MVRAELEVQYFKNSAGGASDSSGGNRRRAATTNGLRVSERLCQPGSFLGLAPYVGVGLGKAKIDLDQFNAQQGGRRGSVLGRNMANGYQLMAGLQYHVFGKATAGVELHVMYMGSFQTHDFASNLRQDISTGLTRFRDRHCLGLLSQRHCSRGARIAAVTARRVGRSFLGRFSCLPAGL